MMSLDKSSEDGEDDDFITIVHGKAKMEQQEKRNAEKGTQSWFYRIEIGLVVNTNYDWF